MPNTSTLAHFVLFFRLAARFFFSTVPDHAVCLRTFFCFICFSFFFLLFFFFLAAPQALSANLKLLELGERERKATAATRAKEDAAARMEAERLVKESEVRKRVTCQPECSRKHLKKTFKGFF